LLGLSLAFYWISDTCFGLLQKYDRLDSIAQSLILKGLLCLALLSLAMYVTRSLVWASAALAVGRGLILWLVDVNTASRLDGPARLTWNGKKLSALLKGALPLGVISALTAFNFNIPRYFVESDLSTRDLGIYSAVASLVGAGNLVMSALANSSFVAIARSCAEHDWKQYRSLSLRLLGTASALGGVGVAAAIAGGDRLLVLLFRPEYGGSAKVFITLMIGGALGYIISGQGYALTAAQTLLPQIPILLCAAATTALFSWWLVPIRGLRGAAEAWALSSLVQIILGAIVIARLQHDDVAVDGVAPVAQAASAEAR
jgi:O-antigen/teichoic acid export membrane protein